MIPRMTQSAAYWEALVISPADLDHLYNHLLEANEPRNIDDLAFALIEYRFRQEEAALTAELSKGALYQPRDTYEAGQKLVFPAFNFRAGSVTETRTGRNPEHGDFLVIKVVLEGEQRPREFASALSTPHKLNRPAGQDGNLLDSEGLLSPAELYAGVAVPVRQKLESRLKQSDGHEFVEADGQWLLKAMLADIHIGYLNLAEAAIEERNAPVSTGDLLKVMELPSEIPTTIKTFSLIHALLNDPRFDDVGSGRHRWFLRRLEPDAAVEPPQRLHYQPEPYTRLALTPELVRLEQELDDEWSDGVEGGVTSDVTDAQITLIYPHRRSGTLPLSARTQGLFPSPIGSRSQVTLIDGHWGQRIPAWVVPGERFVAGLGAWYDQNKLPVGAYLTLERTRNNYDVKIDYKPRRMKREWARLARAENGQLLFENRKLEISCEYDELMILGELNPAEIDALRQSLYNRSVSLQELLYMVMPELTKLSSQGTAHVKTLYSAINLLRRVPPGPIFSILATDPVFSNVGGGYWKFTLR
ncbi:MAG: hypothetical protein IT330_05375 [Anaerolineae bacterium]|nr:hypothetical protein [Anaerolineae bacterium]